MYIIAVSGYVYIVPCYRSYNSSGTDQYVYRHEIGTQTASVTGYAVRYRMGNSAYWSPTSKKVYDFATGEEETVTMGTYNRYANDDKQQENGYSTVCCALNVTSTGITVLFLS